MFSSLPFDLLSINLHPVSPHGNTVQAFTRSVSHDELSLTGQPVPVSLCAEVIGHAVGEGDRCNLHQMLDLEEEETNRGRIGEKNQFIRLLIDTQACNN